MMMAEFTGNPMGFALKQGAKTIMGKNLRNSMNKLDENLIGYIQAALARFADLGEGKGSLSSLFKAIGNKEKYKEYICEFGDSKFMYNYALSIYSETGEYTREVDTWLKKAAEKDHVMAMYELGLFASEQGRIEDSKKWYAKAAERGHTTAMNNLANIYSKEENEKEAIKFYLKAAEKSNPLALFNVGNYYEKNKNIKLAKQYYSKVLHVLKEYPDILKEYSASDLETETMNRLLYLEKNFDEDAETE